MEGISLVICWEERTSERLADKTEEFFPAARDNETNKFSMSRVDLILVDCALGDVR